MGRWSYGQFSSKLAVRRLRGVHPDGRDLGADLGCQYPDPAAGSGADNTTEERRGLGDDWPWADRSAEPNSPAMKNMRATSCESSSMTVEAHSPARQRSCAKVHRALYHPISPPMTYFNLSPADPPHRTHAQRSAAGQGDIVYISPAFRGREASRP